MTRIATRFLLPLTIALLLLTLAALNAQQPRENAAAVARRQAAVKNDFDAHRPRLVFRAEWKRQDAPQHPVKQDDLIDQRVELKLYGDGKNIVWTQHAQEPTYAFTGLCETNCAVAFRDKANYVDLTGLARIRWRSMQTGFHLLRPILKLADGTWIAGDYADGATLDWRESDITLADLRWRRLDMTKVVEFPDGKWADHPDLSKVDEIGFTDLSIGPGHGPRAPASRVAWLEVYGKPVRRPSSQ